MKKIKAVLLKLANLRIYSSVLLLSVLLSLCNLESIWAQEAGIDSSLESLMDTSEIFPSGNGLAEPKPPEAAVTSPTSQATPSQDLTSSQDLPPQSNDKSYSSAADAQNKKALRNISVLELEEYIASQKYNQKPGIEEKSILVRAYERMVLALCFPPLIYLVNNQSLEADPRCQETLGKLSALQQNNPVAICAKSGVDSLDCVRSFEMQTVRKYKPGEIEKLNLSEKQKDPLAFPSVKARFVELQKKLLLAIDKFKADKTVENLISLDASLYPVLSIICSNDALALTVEQPDSNDPTSSGPKFDNSLSIAESIRSLEQEFVDPTPKPAIEPKTALQVDKNIYYRSRILSNPCYDTIVDAVTIDNRLTSPICLRDGYISPSCLSALRRFKKIREINKKPASNDSDGRDGLASF